MLKSDSACTLAPYFEVRDGQADAFKTLASEFLAKTRNEVGCLDYAFYSSGNIAHCRKAYVDADALLTQLQNVEELLAQAGRISKIIRLEVHAPELELEKLHGPMGGLNPQFFSFDKESALAGNFKDAAPTRSEMHIAMRDYVPIPSAAGSFGSKRGRFKLLSPLTQQELQVIKHMDGGATNREMSQCLFVTENTIKFHLKNIFGKLYVSNRLQALIAARDLGLVDTA